MEFQKTALNACRSTITQQQVELNRLKEGMDIRNKRILQLEAQIGHASEFISARDNPNDTAETPLHAVLNRIEGIENKLINLLPPQPCNNIVINSCQSPNLKQRNTVMTQTDFTYHVSDEDIAVTDNISGHESSEHGDSQAPPRPSL